MPKVFETRVMPLADLSRRVEEFAELCCPDFVYTDTDHRDMGFSEITLSALTGDENDGVMDVGLLLRDADSLMPHAFTRWSRSQLLSHMGVREKWFQSVGRQDEAQELNRRLGTVREHMIRTMRSYDAPNIRVVRGFVSRRYADIPDTDIMRSLTSLMPDGFCLRSYSGKTDRAFYAYAITSTPIGIPGTSFGGLPGVVIRNSEVGFTSLWVVPMLFVTARSASGDVWVPVVLEKQPLLRRVHRGSVEDLTASFDQALKAAAAIWGPLEAKMTGLGSVRYHDEDTAISTMSALLRAAGATKLFTHRCDQAYKTAHHTTHGGVSVFDTILGALREESNQDDAYTTAAIAGAVLLKLIT